jgi:hypothetical protein
MYKVGDVFVGADELHKGYVMTLLKCVHEDDDCFEVRWEIGGKRTVHSYIDPNTIDTWVRRGYIAPGSGKEYEDML